MAPWSWRVFAGVLLTGAAFTLVSGLLLGIG